MKTQQKFALGLVGGMLVGATAGMLLAPRSGKEARQALSSRAGQMVKRIRKSPGAYNSGESLGRRVGLSA